MNNIRLPIMLAITDKLLEAFCTRNHIQRMALFGSVLREDFTPESDVDVLVEFDPAHVPGLIRLEMMQIELSEMLGREVDLLTPKSLHPSIREQALKQSQVIYDAA